MWILILLGFCFLFIVVPLFYVAIIGAGALVTMASTGANRSSGRAGLVVSIFSFMIFVFFIFSRFKAGWNGEHFMEPFAADGHLIFNWRPLSAGFVAGLIFLWVVYELTDRVIDTRLTGITSFLFATSGLVLFYNHFFVYFLHDEAAWSILGILAGTGARMTFDPGSFKRLDLGPAEDEKT